MFYSPLRGRANQVIPKRISMEKTMKRILVFAICLVLTFSAFSLAGCQGDVETSVSSDEKTTITFMGWGTDEEIATYEAMIAQFESVYTNVDVEYITVADNEFDTKLQTMIGAGESPDVFYCSIDKMMKYAATGNLYDLTEYVENNEIFDADNVWDVLINLYRYDGENQGAGSIYALPKDVSVFPIVYNVDMFKAAGITPPTQDNPWDWNDYLDAAQKLTTGEGDEKIYGSGAYSLESAVWSNGAEWVDAETLTEVQIDDPTFTEAMQWAADLSLVYGVAPTRSESESLGDYDRFKQGNVAMIGTGSWSFGDLWENCDFEWDVMNWPVSPNTGESEIWFGSAGLAVSSTTDNAEAASNLAAYLAFNEDAQRTAYTKGQAIPTLKDMATGEYMQFENAPASKDVLVDILENHARLATQSRTFNQEWFSEFNSNSGSVFTGEMTAVEFSESIKNTMQQLLDDSIAQKAEFSN
jgi:multiple sugar transport system substrate-binding protein